MVKLEAYSSGTCTYMYRAKERWLNIMCTHFCHFKEVLKVEGPLRRDEAVERDGGQIADRHLICIRVLHYLSAQVAGLDGTKVLGGGERSKMVQISAS